MVKRTFDFIASFVGIIILSPVFIIITLLIRKRLGFPVIFKQERPGMNGKIFTMYKFRSMKDAYDGNGNPLPDSERITDFGKKLRSTSLDELPELWNVLKGDMSLVGPRPLLVEYLPYYTEKESLRHTVRPGITGLAQVNGRNNISWDQKLALDVEYVKHRNILLDIKIIFLTIVSVISKKDVNVIPSSKGTLLSIERSDNYILRPILKKDLKTRISWINDPKVYSTMNINVPVTEEGTQTWFNKVKDDKGRIDFALEENGTLVAMSGLIFNDSKTAEQYTFVDPNKKGQGIGTLMHFMWLTYGFNILNLEKVISIIDISNNGSRKCSEKVGFVLSEIRKKDLYKNGVYVDRCYYSCTRDSFNQNLFSFTIKNNNVIHRRKKQ